MTSFSCRAFVAIVLSLLAAPLGATNGGRPSRRLSPPRLLSQTGLYARGTLSIDGKNLPYSPQYPLWSDGAAKRRWVFLPSGRTIETRNLAGWVFPVGTKFWKEFSFGGTKVETRLMWRTSSRDWLFASYAWNAAQTDATLVPAGGLPNTREIVPGKFHSIPSEGDCRACHENGRVLVLGFDALQLSTDRDPLAPHAETLEPGMATLETLVRDRRLSPRRAELLAAPPRVDAATPRARAILGYLSTNCGNCHSPDGPLASLGLDLRQSPVRRNGSSNPALLDLIGRRGEYRFGADPNWNDQRIVAGLPAQSTLVHRMASRNVITQMPPLGTVLPDDEALVLLRSWIVEDLAPSR